MRQAQKVKNDKLNVLDYYKLEPDNALDSEAMQAKVTITDLKNGYLKIEGAFEGHIEVALFRKKDKSPILVISNTSCGPVCNSEISAYTPEDGKMIDITKDTVPRVCPNRKSTRFITARKKPEMMITAYMQVRWFMDCRVWDERSRSKPIKHLLRAILRFSNWILRTINLS